MIFNMLVQNGKPLALEASAHLPASRVAVRGILRRDKEVLLVENFGREYSFPGGGVETGESLEEALNREILEEVGLYVIKMKLIGQVLDERINWPKDSRVWAQKNYYYIIQVDEKKQEIPRLTKLEQKGKMTPKWMSLDVALYQNERVLQNKGNQSHPYLYRETAVMCEMNQADIKKQWQGTTL